MIKLNLGCGVLLKEGFINVDKYYTEENLRSKKGMFENCEYPEGAIYIQADILKLPFPDNYADYAESLDVIEHMGLYEVIPYLQEIRRVLKPEAKLLLLTPDFTGLALDFIRYMANEKEFNWDNFIQISEQIFGNQRYYGEFHRCPITPPFIKFCLERSGWSSCSIEGFVKNTPCELIYKDTTTKPTGFARCDMLKIYATK